MSSQNSYSVSSLEDDFIKRRLQINGVNVDALTVAELHQLIKQIAVQNKSELVLNVNVNCINLAHKNPWLKRFLNKAYIVFCDGVGVQFGAKILGHYIPERITYADWMWELSEYAEDQGLTMFFLGAKAGIAEQAGKNLQDKFPELKIVGYQHGYFEKSQDHQENEAVIQKINDVKPNILLVSFGMPLQEKWLMENWDKIDANVALTGGAALDYLAGNLARAPKWMTDNGLEWLGRMLIEPRRLWRRYIIGNPVFLLRVLKQRLFG